MLDPPRIYIVLDVYLMESDVKASAVAMASLRGAAAAERLLA
jgi:hypothetical protein